jgi:hypothetical protein
MPRKVHERAERSSMFEGKVQQAGVLKAKCLTTSKVRERWLEGMFSKRVTKRNDHLSLHDGGSTPLTGARDRRGSRRAFGVSGAIGVDFIVS